MIYDTFLSLNFDYIQSYMRKSLFFSYLYLYYLACLSPVGRCWCILMLWSWWPWMPIITSASSSTNTRIFFRSKNLNFKLDQSRTLPKLNNLSFCRGIFFNLKRVQFLSPIYVVNIYLVLITFPNLYDNNQFWSNIFPLSEHGGNKRLHTVLLFYSHLISGVDSQ